MKTFGRRILNAYEMLLGDYENVSLREPALSERQKRGGAWAAR